MPIIHTNLVRAVRLLERLRIRQTVHATSSMTEDTNSTSFVGTNLEASITPEAIDSVILVFVSARVRAVRTSSSTNEQYGEFRIRNITDGQSIEGAELLRVGADLASAGQTAAQWAPFAPVGQYQVDSTAQRTFRLQMRSPSADVQVTLRSLTKPLMVLMEVRP